MSEFNKVMYNRQAASYEKRWKSYLQHTHEKFIQSVESAGNEILLDLSCGTGLLALELLEASFPFKELILNDPSEKMMEIAHGRLASHSNIHFTNYAVENLGFEPNQFDRIFCLNAFHFYSQQEHVIEELYSLLKPGGTFYILDWNRSGFFKAVNKIIQWSTSERITTLSLGEIEQMLQGKGFTIVTSEAWSWYYWKFFFLQAGK